MIRARSPLLPCKSLDRRHQTTPVFRENLEGDPAILMGYDVGPNTRPERFTVRTV
jgi:hypothetical protein